MKNLLINLEERRIIGHHDDFKALEDWAEKNAPYNYDIVDSEELFGRSYTHHELSSLYESLTGEKRDFFSDRHEVAVDVIRRALRVIEIPEVNLFQGVRMKPKKETTAPKEKPEKKVVPTRSKIPADAKLTQGLVEPKSGSVKGDIYSYCSKPMTMDELMDSMISMGYSRKDGTPVDKAYLRGYITTMVRSEDLVVQ